MNTTTSYEHLVRTHDPELHALVVDELASLSIPDFTKDIDAAKRWELVDETSYRRSVWSALYHELSSTNRYEDVVDILNTPHTSFHNIGAQRLSEFIETFPTLLWTLLLQTSTQSIKAFRLLLIADKLDFIDDTVHRVGGLRQEFTTSTQYTYPSVVPRVWPSKLTTSLLKGIRSVDAAKRLMENITKSDVVVAVNEVKNGQFGPEEQGMLFYAAATDILTPAEWLRMINNSAVYLPEDLIIYLVDRMENIQKDTAYQLVISATQRSYARFLEALLKRFSEFSPLSLPIIASVNTIAIAQLLVKYNVQLPVSWWSYWWQRLDLHIFEYLAAHGGLRTGRSAEIVISRALESSPIHTAILLDKLGTQPFRAVGALQHLVTNHGDAESAKLLIDAGFHVFTDMLNDAIEHRQIPLAYALLEGIKPSISPRYYDAWLTQIAYIE